MLNTIVFDNIKKPNEKERNEIVDFLFVHLEEYGDPREHILKAINYAIQEFNSLGGFVLEIKENDLLAGVVVINKTGMGGYIPENILVYLAVHKDKRGRGFGKLLMEKVIKLTQGDIALHVEQHNPAKLLYEKLGFTNPYLEMRLKKN